MFKWHGWDLQSHWKCIRTQKHFIMGWSFWSNWLYHCHFRCSLDRKCDIRRWDQEKRRDYKEYMLLSEFLHTDWGLISTNKNSYFSHFSFVFVLLCPKITWKTRREKKKKKKTYSLFSPPSIHVCIFVFWQNLGLLFVCLFCIKKFHLSDCTPPIYILLMCPVFHSEKSRHRSSKRPTPI